MSWSLDSFSNLLQDVGGVIDSGADIYSSLQQFKVDPLEVQKPAKTKTKPATYSDPVESDSSSVSTLLLIGGGLLVVVLLLRRR